jgi:hypothetical protein
MGGFTDFVSTSISSNAAALGKVSDMIPTKWSQQIDGALGKLGGERVNHCINLRTFHIIHIWRNL